MRGNENENKWIQGKCDQPLQCNWQLVCMKYEMRSEKRQIHAQQWIYNKFLLILIHVLYESVLFLFIVEMRTPIYNAQIIKLAKYYQKLALGEALLIKYTPKRTKQKTNYLTKIKREKRAE